MGALSKLDEFHLSPQVRTCSVAVPGTSRKSNSESREPIRDRSLDDHRPELVFSYCQTSNLNDSEHEETHYRLIGVPEEIPYCSLGTSSAKQKKARSTSQLQLRSENIPATIEADQILLALQQMATNSNSANFNNINSFSKVPKPLTTTMPTFDGKLEKFELIENLFQTCLKIHNQLMGEDKENSSTLSWVVMRYKHSKISPASTENLGGFLTVFPRKYVKSQSIATAKHKFQRQVFNPANQK